MNMGVTLAVYGTIAARPAGRSSSPAPRSSTTGRPTSPTRGSWPATSTWAATSPAGANEAFNMVNGDTFHWRQMWEVVAVGPRASSRRRTRATRRRWSSRWPTPPPSGGGIAERYGLAEPDVEPAGAVVAHRQRPGPHRRDLRRHDQEPGGRLPRRPGQPPLVPGPVRPAPAGAGHPRGGVLMKAVQFQGVDKLALAEIDPPKIADDEVLVTLRSVGICHSDFELLEGRYIIPFDYPIIPGHEWAGQVVEVGKDVTDFKPGDRVLGECVIGMEHFGFSISGAAAEFFVARPEWLHHVPEELTRHPGRARRAVQLRLLRRHARGQPQRQRHRRRVRRRPDRARAASPWPRPWVPG